MWGVGQKGALSVVVAKSCNRYNESRLDDTQEGLCASTSILLLVTSLVSSRRFQPVPVYRSSLKLRLFELEGSVKEARQLGDGFSAPFESTSWPWVQVLVQCGEDIQ